MKTILAACGSWFGAKRVAGFARRDRRPMLRKASACALLALIAFGLNFHVLFLQMYGWSNMTVDHHRETGSWVQAAERTFSGEAPCDFCRHVAETMLTGGDSGSIGLFGDTIHLTWLFVLPVKVSPVMPSPPGYSATIDSFTTEPDTLTFSPQAPPPRGAAA